MRESFLLVGQALAKWLAWAAPFAFGNSGVMDVSNLLAI